MNKKTLLILLVGGLMAAALFLIFRPQKNLYSPATNEAITSINIEPSKTVKEYSDSSGFSFNYPDNLSLGNNELKDNNTYAQLQLTAKGVNGSLNLTIADSKFKSIDEWVKDAKLNESPKEVNLGNLNALEIITNEKLLLGALDQGVLFTIEVAFEGNKAYWMKVYSSVVKDFSFAPPVDASVSQGLGSPDDVSFEGEEVVE